MGLLIMILGLALFIGDHVFIPMRERRAVAIARLGEWPYKGVLALASLVGIILIGYGFGWYRTAGMINVWSPPTWTRHVTDLLVWPAIIFVVAAYSRGDIARVLKHPMLVGVKLWALAHLISNGDLGSIILFGSILGSGGVGRLTPTRRTRTAAEPPRWERSLWGRPPCPRGRKSSGCPRPTPAPAGAGSRSSRSPPIMPTP